MIKIDEFLLLINKLNIMLTFSFTCITCIFVVFIILLLSSLPNAKISAHSLSSYHFFKIFTVCQVIITKLYFINMTLLLGYCNILCIFFNTANTYSIFISFIIWI